MSNPATTATAGRSVRRHDLDWLRIIAFGLLILYHIGMFYVTWDWHIKSSHASGLVEPLMSLVNPWRLALLFFISGVAVRFASDRQGAGRFAGRRILRLLPPIVFGMLVIVPPQTYLELRFKWGIAPDPWQFYRNYLSVEQVYPMITPTWNHLWYVVYLLAYTLVLMPILPRLRSLAEAAGPAVCGWLARGRLGWRLLVLPVLPFLAYEAILAPRFPTTHALVDDWAAHADFLTIFLYGYLAAREDRFWRLVARATPTAVLLAVAIAVVSMGLSGADSHAEPGMKTALATLRIVYAWSVIVALLGLAGRFLNRPGPALSYLNEAVFPYYILHQTVIIVVAYPLIGAGVPAAAEALVVTVATVFGCVVLHEYAIRRSAVLRPLFGLKPRPKVPPASEPVCRQSAGSSRVDERRAKTLPTGEEW